MHRTPRTALAAAAALLALVACSNDDVAPDWGVAAETFFADWSEAWAAADPYDVVRFYDQDVAVVLAQDYRSLSLNAGYIGTALGGEGRVWLAGWIDKQYEPRHRSLNAVYLGEAAAVTVTTVAEVETAIAVTMELGDTKITGYTDLRWRDAHLPGGAPDPRLGWLDTLTADYVNGWTETGQGQIGDLYATGATIERFPGQKLDLGAALAAPEFIFRDATIAPLATGSRTGPAIFVGPDTAAFVLSATLSDGCQAELIVNLTLENDVIVRERRMPTADSVRRCFPDEAPESGWWNSLATPPPVEEQVTGAVRQTNGPDIQIINGTAQLEKLLEWGLERFAQADLVPPLLRSATFAPVPACANVPGVVTEADDGAVDLVLCTDTHQACLPDRATCAEFRIADRLGMLHELGHAWLLDNLTDVTADEFLELNGLTDWLRVDTPWHQRGAEQAAEMMAWGLLEDPVRLVRIGDPPCAQVAGGYEVLTGTAARHECGG